MMGKMHADFKEPENRNAKIWRYLDFAKYIDMLNTRALYFARVHQFSDPFEGSYLPSFILKPEFQHREVRDIEKSIVRHNAKECNKLMAVNCWHMSEHESDAMWKLYSKGNKGIAVESTFDRLKQVLGDSCSAANVGMVQYLDYDSEVFHENGAISLYEGVMHKRKSFEHEREVRAVIYTPKGICDMPVHCGFPVPVDVRALVVNVYVCPTADNCFVRRVERETQKHKCDFNVIKSSLYETPPY